MFIYINMYIHFYFINSVYKANPHVINTSLKKSQIAYFIE